VPPTHAQTLKAFHLRAAAAGLVAIVLAVPARTHAAQLQGQARAELGSGYDSNAGHDVDGQGQGDGVVLGVLQLQGALYSNSSVFALAARYDLGAKKFFSLSEQDLLAQQATLQASARAGPLTLGLLAAGKDRRSRLGDRDYTDGSGVLFGEARPHKWPLRFDLGAELFAYHPDPTYSFAGPTADFSVTAPLAAHHRLRLAVDGAFHVYDPRSLVLGELRRDGTAGGTLTYRYQGRFVGELAYDFLADLSNLRGASFQRHRLLGNVAVFLPWRIVLAGSAALQFTRFPEGATQINPESLEADEAENTNSLAVSLSRALPLGFRVELKGAGYQSSYATNGLSYHRATVQLSVGWKG